MKSSEEADSIEGGAVNEPGRPTGGWKSPVFALLVEEHSPCCRELPIKVEHVPAYQYFTIENHGDVTLARAVDTHLQGFAQAEFVKEELIQIMQSTPRRLVVDFHNVRMISSAVISSLLVVKSRAVSEGKQLSVTMYDSLRAVFSTLNLDGTVLEIYTTTAQALASSPRSDSYYDVCGEVSPPDEDADLNVY